MALKVNDRWSIPFSELHFEYSRSSGPGGQNVNKVNSKAQLSFNFLDHKGIGVVKKKHIQNQLGTKLKKDGWIKVSSQRYRDQARNVADALEKLKNLLAKCYIVQRTRKKTKVPKSSKRKRITDKKLRSEIKGHRKAIKL